jgi:peptidoglycan/LPS O-acetylase OafA/YrhL
MLFLGLFLYCYSPSVTVRIINSRFIEFFNDWLIAGGVLIFIVIALSSNKVSIILRNKVFSFLGDISYSLYLFHFVILTALLNLLYGKINTGLIFVITISLSIIVAWISYKYVEIPSVKLGKIIVKRSKKNTELDINSKAV